MFLIRLPHASNAWRLVATVVGVIACTSPQQVDVGGQQDDCEAQPTLAGSGAETGSGWEKSVLQLIDTAPPDSLVSVAFGGIRVPLREFTAIVENHEGKVTYVFQTIPAVSVTIPVRGLADLFELRGDLYGYISVGRRGGGVLTECGPKYK